MSSKTAFYSKEPRRPGGIGNRFDRSAVAFKKPVHHTRSKMTSSTIPRCHRGTMKVSQPKQRQLVTFCCWKMKQKIWKMEYSKKSEKSEHFSETHEHFFKKKLALFWHFFGKKQALLLAFNTFFTSTIGKSLGSTFWKDQRTFSV